jgi:16S rRNA (guanine527-N7)-methyltransferase
VGASRDFAARLQRRATRAGLSLPVDLLTALDAYYALLSRWNQRINLTSIGNRDEAVDRLLLEPLLAARFVASGARAFIDIGSGGGSPAIPLKLALPHLALTMVEAKTRKAAFLREAVRHLGLRETGVENARAEELLPRTDLHEAFSLLTVRAVRIEARLLNTLQAFVEPAGQLLLFRGPSGPDAPPAVVPPLAWGGTYPLMEALQSRLTVVVKRRIGLEGGP